MFEKRANWAIIELMRLQYKNKINEDNIESLSWFKIKKILKDETPKDREIFLHSIISRWIKIHETRDVDFIKNLKAIIRKTKIKLNNLDTYDLVLLEERSFSSYRHIKILNVSAELEAKEHVGIKFVKAQLYQKTERLTLVLEGDLLISNKRIFFENVKDKAEMFFWDEIISYSYENYGFSFKIKNVNYVIRIHDQESLNNTLRNMISKKMKNIISKEINTENI